MQCPRLLFASIGVVLPRTRVQLSPSLLSGMSRQQSKDTSCDHVVEKVEPFVQASSRFSLSPWSTCLRWITPACIWWTVSPILKERSIGTVWPSFTRLRSKVGISLLYLHLSTQKLLHQETWSFRFASSLLLKEVGASWSITSSRRKWNLHILCRCVMVIWLLRSVVAFLCSLCSTAPQNSDW